MPTQKALLVISQASQVTAMRCTQSPVQEVREAAKNSRASRCDSARPSAPKAAGPRNAIARASPASAGAAAVWVFCWTQSAAIRSRSKIRPSRSVSPRRA